jgi:hypothetical protein
MRYVLVIVFLLTACSSDVTSPPAGGSSSVTPKGAKVIVVEGDRPTADDLAEIDRQISRIKEIADGLNRGYNWPEHSRYVIELVDPSTNCETPGSFKIPAGQYGSGMICVAGQYFPTTDRIRTTLVAIRTSKIVQYEAEHFGLKYDDPVLYAETLTHVPPNGHPIFGIE